MDEVADIPEEAIDGIGKIPGHLLHPALESIMDDPSNVDAPGLKVHDDEHGVPAPGLKISGS